MDKKVLVAYATKYGSTEEIAQKIGQVILEMGLPVDVLSTKRITDLTPYDAIVLGSAVYEGQWLKEAVTFLQTNQQRLAQHPVWLFSSGPTGNGEPAKGWRFPAAQQSIADHIKPRDIVVFRGLLNFKKLNFVEKLMLKAVKAPVGDFRDWAAITAWASVIADTIPR